MNLVPALFALKCWGFYGSVVSEFVNLKLWELWPLPHVFQNLFFWTFRTYADCLNFRPCYPSLGVLNISCFSIRPDCLEDTFLLFKSISVSSNTGLYSISTCCFTLSGNVTLQRWAVATTSWNSLPRHFWNSMLSSKSSSAKSPPSQSMSGCSLKGV